MRRGLGIFTAGLAAVSPAHAESNSGGWSPVPATAVYETGDSWTDHGVLYRLYGVQACIRGTSFTNAVGQKRDCGEASLAMLVALTRDLRPQCHEAASLPRTRTVFVFCIAQPTTGAAAGSRIDLGTALISTGYAFAALTPDGKPVHPPYFVAQLVAQKSRAGLWAFADAPEPNAIILKALRAATAATTLSDPARLPTTAVSPQ
jgi:endonuclease YncB( thermonuclease family)